jgi:hypothetical protein
MKLVAIEVEDVERDIFVGMMLSNLCYELECDLKREVYRSIRDDAYFRLYDMRDDINSLIRRGGARLIDEELV